eukprot:TRINITY_DN1835_c0_g1_i15.p1 TRINITY_DN1835_c0_g1~~TRINITY_DN1835_c0_g1_i15.p1  ORF type:complete len:128 (+),score=18.15 TRINITY_DN1835_c0_g1_i15:306-689(+)
MRQVSVGQLMGATSLGLVSSLQDAFAFSELNLSQSLLIHDMALIGQSHSHQKSALLLVSHLEHESGDVIAFQGGLSVDDSTRPCDLLNLHKSVRVRTRLLSFKSVASLSLSCGGFVSDRMACSSMCQ